MKRKRLTNAGFKWLLIMLLLAALIIVVFIYFNRRIATIEHQLKQISLYSEA